jgi:hypothetical protein
MSDLLIGLCSYFTLQSGMQTNACHTAITQIYTISPIKQPIEAEEQYIANYGKNLYMQIPLHDPLGAIFFIGNDIYKKDYKIPLYNHVDLEYSNYTNYTCNLHWSF